MFFPSTPVPSSPTRSPPIKNPRPYVLPSIDASHPTLSLKYRVGAMHSAPYTPTAAVPTQPAFSYLTIAHPCASRSNCISSLRERGSCCTPALRPTHASPLHNPSLISFFVFSLSGSDPPLRRRHPPPGHPARAPRFLPSQENAAFGGIDRRRFVVGP